MRLNNYTLDTYTTGAAYWKQLLWYFLGSPLIESHWIPFSAIKVKILRAFGAKIRTDVRCGASLRCSDWRTRKGYNGYGCRLS